MLTYGFEGAIRIASAASIASSTPGAACGSPSKRTPSTSSRWPRATNHSWNAKLPAGVSIQVRRRSSVAGRIAGSIPSARASRAVTAESGSPARSACVRTRWRPRSRSPSRNQSSPPRADDRCRAPPTSRRPGPSRAPRRGGLRGRRGCCRGRARPTSRAPRGRRRRCRRSSDLRRPAASTRPRAKRAPPTPPERSTTFTAAGRGRSRPASSGRPAGRSGRRSSSVSTSSLRFGIAQEIAGTPRLSAWSRKRAALPPP